MHRIDNLLKVLSAMLVPMSMGCVTITIDSSTNGATTMSRMNLSGYVGHATIFSLMLIIACCLVVGLGLGLNLD